MIDKLWLDKPLLGLLLVGDYNNDRVTCASFASCLVDPVALERMIGSVAP